MGTSFLSRSNKVSVYSPSIRSLVSKLRLLSAQTGTATLNSTPVRTQFPFETQSFSCFGQLTLKHDVPGKSETSSDVFHSTSKSYLEKLGKDCYRAHADKLFEASTLSDQPDTAVYDSKKTESAALPKAVELKVVECPETMKQKVRDLFPGKSLCNLSVLNLTQKTQNDMSVWGADMEIEWMVASSAFVETAIEACKILKRFGYWADFIDPSTGKPYLSKQQASATLNVTDEEYKSLGFDVSDLGCCRILAHKLWGTKVFLGTIFTDAPIDSPPVIEIISKAGSA